ncbi:toll/interleukin-1 receptor domain-containing protein [Actinokineospora terrae]|uniref:Uncharacterized protein n=1 Tax=Actinokineospora terrae TaxID=155974 RepID=A0A1H9NV85_9PSEU|nr:toll/interleukin-1 receptor domain-containing protein [Actinokineospora terrae]SER39860.1 hypothetical protein SAMN04487818_103154 [Actinokineospora terrae]
MTDPATHDDATHDAQRSGGPVGAITDQDHDIAISFAEDQRTTAEVLVRACEQRGLIVLHGPEQTHEWWDRKGGGDLPGARVRYFVPLVSAIDEFTEAALRAVKAGDEHVLPALVGDVSVPADLLHPHVTYPRGDADQPDRFVDALATRVEAAETAGTDRALVADVVGRVKARVEVAGTPVTFSRYAQQDAVLRYLGEQFAAAMPGLDRSRFTGTVHIGDSRIAVRVEQAGDTVYALDIQRGGIGGDETVNFVVGRHDAGSACSNGWARPVYDATAGALLELRDLSLLGGGSDTRTYREDELFAALWKRVNAVLTATTGD